MKNETMCFTLSKAEKRIIIKKIKKSKRSLFVREAIQEYYRKIKLNPELSNIFLEEESEILEEPKETTQTTQDTQAPEINLILTALKLGTPRTTAE
ncbi:hypothetical protein C6V80_09950 (plasmid) [Caminibacter pacificus]|uniref:Ribbon-helix-helix protein CopG domain-containing protein n=1 Tax=Caminibacter pacificus TaxID=1424653 RepID=A0ABX5VVI9_9BACT|nr:hypothetical protein [Caminibacter pacificus]QDD68167.1 hypothetical protein C6V80_09950 [Caminibacter pacificus]